MDIEVRSKPAVRLPRRAEIVAYCRGPYYVLAPQAVERRRGHGYRAWRAGGAEMKTLVICNDPPYGTERSWNGLRLAEALARRPGEEVRVFLLGDAVGCAITGQKVPDGCYHLDRMIGSAERHGAEIGCCGTCLDARGITEELLTKGTHRSTLDELADWTLWADKVITF